MNDCNMRIGYNNRMPLAALTAEPTPSTPLAFIKDEWRARQAVWAKTKTDGNVIIRGTFETPVHSQFLAIPGIDLVGDVEVHLALYLSPDVNLDLLSMPFVQARRRASTNQKALRDWVAGVDAYGGIDESVMPKTFVHWFDNPLYYDSFKLTIRRASDSTVKLENVRMRMLFLGDMLEVDRNFSYGHTIKFINSRSMTQTASGSWINTRRQVESRQVNLSLNNMTIRDYDRLLRLESGLSGDPFILSAFPDNPHNSLRDSYNMLARFGNELEFGQRFGTSHRSDFIFLEV